MDEWIQKKNLSIKLGGGAKMDTFLTEKSLLNQAHKLQHFLAYNTYILIYSKKYDFLS